jgi:hypothetical protein
VVIFSPNSWNDVTVQSLDTRLVSFLHAPTSHHYVSTEKQPKRQCFQLFIVLPSGHINSGKLKSLILLLGGGGAACCKVTTQTQGNTNTE